MKTEKKKRGRPKNEGSNYKTIIATKYNWPKISKEYIEGYRTKWDDVTYPTYEELGKKYNINPKIIAKHGIKEQWGSRRIDFQATVEQIESERAAKRRARDIESFREDCFKVANTGKWVLAKKMEETVGASKAGKALMPLSDVESVSRSLERFQTVGHRSLGVPDKATAISGPNNTPIQINSWADLMKMASEDDKANGNPSPADQK